MHGAIENFITDVFFNHDTQAIGPNLGYVCTAGLWWLKT